TSGDTNGRSGARDERCARHGRSGTRPATRRTQDLKRSTEDAMGSGRIVPLALALAGALALAAPATARVSHVKKALTPTGKAPRARGTANLVVRGSKGRLGISA